MVAILDFKNGRLRKQILRYLGSLLAYLNDLSVWSDIVWHKEYNELGLNNFICLTWGSSLIFKCMPICISGFLWIELLLELATPTITTKGAAMIYKISMVLHFIFTLVTQVRRFCCSQCDQFRASYTVVTDLWPPILRLFIYLLKYLYTG